MRKFLIISILLASGAALASDQQSPAARLGAGYLPANAVDSVSLLPPVPTKGSAIEQRDRKMSKSALAAQGTERWTIATSDAELLGETATAAFSCAAGFDISPQSTPALDRLLRRSLVDFGLTSSAAKRKYQRARPFMVNKKPSCTPEHEEYLRSDGSYPSGHSAIGMGWGLVLAQLVPDHASRVVARGRAYGESRRYCNVHWQSDVEEGRILGAAVFARLQADAAFQSDLKAAQAELELVPRQAPKRDCAAEAAALING